MLCKSNKIKKYEKSYQIIKENGNCFVFPDNVTEMKRYRWCFENRYTILGRTCVRKCYTFYCPCAIVG